MRHGFSSVSRNTPKVDKGTARGNIENVRKTSESSKQRRLK
nr:MAG TPA: hypothetical protein [Caudoviricetes sp.]